MFDRRSSVFAKLVAVMVTMAATLLLLVGGFFWFIVSPMVSASIDRVREEYARHDRGHLARSRHGDAARESPGPPGAV